jgi:hypothetical protein
MTEISRARRAILTAYCRCGSGAYGTSHGQLRPAVNHLHLLLFRFSPRRLSNSATRLVAELLPVQTHECRQRPGAAHAGRWSVDQFAHRQLLSGHVGAFLRGASPRTRTSTALSRRGFLVPFAGLSVVLGDASAVLIDRPRLVMPWQKPASAASRHQRTASAPSLATPWPYAYIDPSAAVAYRQRSMWQRRRPRVKKTVAKERYCPIARLD